MQYSLGDIPVISPFKHVPFPDFQLDYLSNGIPVYSLPNNDYGVLKMEVNVFAGRFFEEKQAVSRTCANLLREGTKARTSAEIARDIDFYGASMQMMGGMDVIKLELYSMTRHFEKVLPVAADVLTAPLFPENELVKYIKRTIQKLQNDLSKNDILAFRALTENIFGLDHPYGYNTKEETLKKISTQDLRNHFLQTFYAENFSVILAGGFPEYFLSILEEAFGHIPKREKVITRPLPTVTGQQINTRIEGKQKYQSSVKLGVRMFDRTHPDYIGLYFTSTLLGGYFGSRLMQNIREDKGLTYDIYSSVDCMRMDGYFMISAEVDNKSVDQTLSEIRIELKKLAEEPVEQEELELVRNYIKGNLLNILNGPINSVELIRLLSIYGLDKTFYDEFIRGIDSIDAKVINELAGKYLDFDNLSLIICGVR
ncbi:MAG TPA: pitrilysin family protein [Saprospiraceae bacterium]|nr:hypothetical protein [Saprospirales bacterium]HRQ29387.1 pitrilysin family protein [Saprospiraceae bacterium]